jgi:hypothetical protein
MYCGTDLCLLTGAEQASVATGSGERADRAHWREIADDTRLLADLDHPPAGATVRELGHAVKAQHPAATEGMSDAEVGHLVKARLPGKYDGYADVEEGDAAVPAPLLAPGTPLGRCCFASKVAADEQPHAAERLPFRPPAEQR